MKRQDKYPDTSTFHYYNANPKNRFTGDCVFRALATATEKPYEWVVYSLAGIQVHTGYAASNEAIDRLLKPLGWKKMRQPRKADGTKYTGVEFCKELMRYDSEIDSGSDMHHIVANIGGNHTVAIISGRVYDTWNSTEGCVGNYWVKE